MLLFNYYSLLLKELIFSSDQVVLRDTMLSFYSVLAGSMATLFTVSGIFLIFRIETIKSEISRGIDNFRDWVAIRAEDPLLKALGVNWEPHSWLEKDVLDHVEEALKKAKENNHPYVRALTDYLQFIKLRINHQERIKLLSVPPLVLISLIFINALHNLVIVDLLISKYRFELYGDVALELSLLLFLIIYLVFFISYAILEPRNFIINTPKRKS